MLCLGLTAAIPCHGFPNVVGAMRMDVLGSWARENGNRTWAFCGKGPLGVHLKQYVYYGAWSWVVRFAVPSLWVCHDVYHLFAEWRAEGSISQESMREMRWATSQRQGS